MQPKNTIPLVLNGGRLHLVCLIFLFLVFGCLPVNCFGETELVFAGVPNIEPFVISQGDEITGFFPDIFKEVRNRIGFSADLKLYPFKRAYRYLMDGKVDGIISIYYRKEREEYVTFSKIPTLITRINVYVLRGSDFKLTSIEDLYGKRVGIMAGWYLDNREFQQAIADNKFQIDETRTFQAKIMKLLENRVDCFVGSENLVWLTAKNIDVSDRIVKIGDPIAKNYSHLAITKNSKKIPDCTKFMAKIDSALNDIINDGTYRKISIKYFGKEMEREE